MDLDVDQDINPISFEEFAYALLEVPNDNIFMAAFTGALPDRRVVVNPPLSIEPEARYHACDVDSAHLVGPSIPAKGRIAFFTLVNHSFTIVKNLKFKFSLTGFEDPMELKNIPNFRIAQFGDLGRWNVSNNNSFATTVA